METHSEKVISQMLVGLLVQPVLVHWGWLTGDPHDDDCFYYYKK